MRILSRRFSKIPRIPGLYWSHLYTSSRAVLYMVMVSVCSVLILIMCNLNILIHGSYYFAPYIYGYWLKVTHKYCTNNVPILLIKVCTQKVITSSICLVYACVCENSNCNDCQFWSNSPQSFIIHCIRYIYTVGGRWYQWH